MSFPFASFNGSLIPIETASVSAFNIEYAYGFGVYESIRVSKGIAYFLDRHIARLLESARIISLNHTISHDTLCGWVRDLMQSISAESYNLKILLIGSSVPENVQCFILPLNPSFPDKKWYRDGVRVSLSHYERLFPSAKTLNMLGSYLAYTAAKSAGCYDALLCDREGYITEGTRTNVFFVRDEAIVSPPDEAILHGITRDAVLHVARATGVQMASEKIHESRVSTFSGAFLTSTSSKILPIRSIASHTFGEIPSTLRTLMDSFGDFLESSGGVF